MKSVKAKEKTQKMEKSEKSERLNLSNQCEMLRVCLVLMPRRNRLLVAAEQC